MPARAQMGRADAGHRVEHRGAEPGQPAHEQRVQLHSRVVVVAGGRPAEPDRGDAVDPVEDRGDGGGVEPPPVRGDDLGFGLAARGDPVHPALRRGELVRRQPGDRARAAADDDAPGHRRRPWPPPTPRCPRTPRGSGRSYRRNARSERVHFDLLPAVHALRGTGAISPRRVYGRRHRRMRYTRGTFRDTVPFHGSPERPENNRPSVRVD